MNAAESQNNPAPSPARKPPRWLGFALAALVLFAGLVAYSEGTKNGITNWDDNWLISENRYIRDLSIANVVTILNPFVPQEVREELGNEYLPVRDLSYAVNYALEGGYRPAGYHATNLILHLLSSLLVMWLCMRLSGRHAVGFVAGLLFAVHPVHVEAVSWLSSRKDMLATFFALLSLNLYIVARRPRTGLPSQSFVQRVRHSTRLAYMLSVLCFGLALLSKMHAVVVAALLPLLEIFFARRLTGASLARRLLALAPFWILAAAFTLLAMKIGSGLMREPYGDSLYHTWLTALAAVNRDFAVLAFGTPLQAAVDMELRTSLTPQAVGGALALLVLLGLGVAGFIKRDTRKGGDPIWPMLGFCALAFVAALAPVSNFLIQIGTVFAERYLYLPSLAFCLAAAAVGVRLWDGVEKFPAAGALVRGGLVIVLAAATVLYTWQTRRQVPVWRDSTTLWTSVLDQDPANHLAHFNLARELQELALPLPESPQRARMFEDAYAHLRQALQFRRFYPERTYRYDAARIYGALALLEVHRGRAEEALALLEDARKEVDVPWRPERGRRDIEAVLASYRGLALSKLGRHEQALAAFAECLEKSNRYASARINLATELTRGKGDGRFARALAELDSYERERGRDAVSLEARARISYEEFNVRLAASGRGGEKAVPAELRPLLDNARALYRELAALRERERAPAALRAATLIEAADALARGVAGDAEAEDYLRRALVLDPSRVGTRYLLARLLSEREGAGRVEATGLVNEELRLHPDFAPARSFRAIGLLQAGLAEQAALRAAWGKDYAAKFPGENNPSWAALVKNFWEREGFRTGLSRVFAIYRQAAALDPRIEAGAGADVVRLPKLIGEFAYDAGLGLWQFGDKDARSMAEELLRISFNLEPEEGPISNFLTVIYLELAEKAVRENDREEIQKLMKNMLLLSETARKIMGRKLYNKGFAIAQGEGFADNPLTDEARKLLAAEFMQAAILLDPAQIHALDWLKKHYEEEGYLEKALEIYTQFEEALKDRPDLLDGVRLARAQTQFDLGQRLYKMFQKSIERGDKDSASRQSARAVLLYTECVRTLDKNLQRPGRPSVQVLRMKGAALQRLAYFDFARAEHYYTLALQAYGLSPLDFGDELSEVGRKLASVTGDLYKRRDILKKAIDDAPPGKDMAEEKTALAGVENRIIHDEARALLVQDKPIAALARLEPAGDFHDAMLMRLRGDIHMALCARETQRNAKDRWLVAAARDYARAYTDIEAQIKAGVMYQDELALALAEGNDAANIKSRQCLERAERLIVLALENVLPGDPKIAQFQAQDEQVRKYLGRLNELARHLLAAAQREADAGRHAQALERVAKALDAGGDNHAAWQLRGRILAVEAARARAGGDRAGAERLALDARAAFNTALRLDPPLTSQVLTLNLELAELMLDAFGNRRDALFWLDAASRRLEKMDPDLRAGYAARIDALRARVK